jgi:hypothetical protein
MKEHSCCWVHECHCHRYLCRLTGGLRLLLHAHVEFGPFIQRKLNLVFDEYWFFL